MNFQTHKITEEKPKKKFKIPTNLKKYLPKQLPKPAVTIISWLAISGLIIAGIIFAFLLLIRLFGVETILTPLTKELEQDAYGHTNFLILGHGGENHDGGNLMDTIIVGSLDSENNIFTMTSIPRDFYLRDSVIGNAKINEAYYRARNHFDSEDEGVEYMKSQIEEIVGIPIHYWVKVDFKGFKELIDAIGGVEVNVEEAIYDPYYPKDGTYEYEPFSIQAGLQTLDGETALKFARSRKTTSDFDRADRQQQLIYAIKEKAEKLNILTSVGKLQDIYAGIKNNVQTNLDISEMARLGLIAKDFHSDNIQHRLIHDDPNYCGGFLYVPERELFGGAYVQLVAGGNEFLQLYSDLNFNNQEVAAQNKSITILNGTSTPGVAGETYRFLNRLCIDVDDVQNAITNSQTITTYYFKPDLEGNIPALVTYLQKIIPGQISSDIPGEYQQILLNSDVILELGSDYIESPDYISDPFNFIFY